MRAITRPLAVGHGHDVLATGLFEEVGEDAGSKTSIPSREHASAGEGLAQTLQHPMQDADRPACGRPIAQPQRAGEQVLYCSGSWWKARKPGYRQAAPAVAVPVEDGEPPRPVRAVVGRIQADGEVLAASIPLASAA